MWTAAEAYERFMGRWSRRVAGCFLDALDTPDGGAWLDVGCGVGTLTAAIIERCSPAAVVGVDPSPEFLRRAAARKPTACAVAFHRARAERLPFPDAALDAAVSGLTLNFVPDPTQAVREMARVTRAGGTVAAYVWDYANPDFFLARFWDAAARSAGARAAGDERGRWRVCTPAGLADLAERSRLQDARVWSIRIDTVFASPEELWAGFLLGVGPSGSWTTAMAPRDRAALRARLLASLPVAADGAAHLTATALAVAGVRPDGRQEDQDRGNRGRRARRRRWGPGGVGGGQAGPVTCGT